MRGKESTFERAVRCKNGLICKMETDASSDRNVDGFEDISVKNSLLYIEQVGRNIVGWGQGLAGARLGHGQGRPFVNGYPHTKGVTPVPLSLRAFSTAQVKV